MVLDGAGPYSVCSKTLCGDSTACYEVDNYLATEADAMIHILHEYDLDED